VPGNKIRSGEIGRSADESIAQGLRNGFRLRMHLQLLVNVPQVRRNRIDADLERNRRGVVVVPVDEELQESPLVRR
jgi:hypothetical protein